MQLTRASSHTLVSRSGRQATRKEHRLIEQAAHQFEILPQGKALHRDRCFVANLSDGSAAFEFASDLRRVVTHLVLSGFAFHPWPKPQKVVALWPDIDAYKLKALAHEHTSYMHKQVKHKALFYPLVEVKPLSDTEALVVYTIHKNRHWQPFTRVSNGCSLLDQFIDTSFLTPRGGFPALGSLCVKPHKVA